MSPEDRASLALSAMDLGQEGAATEERTNPGHHDGSSEQAPGLSIRGGWQVLRIAERLKELADPGKEQASQGDELACGMRELLNAPIRQEALDRVRAIANSSVRPPRQVRARRLLLLSAALGLASLSGIPADSLLPLARSMAPTQGGIETTETARPDFGATDSAPGRVFAIVDEVGRPTSRNGNLEAGEPPVLPGATPDSSIGVEQPAGSTESQLGAGAQPVLGFESESDSATDGAVTPRRRQ